MVGLGGGTWTPAVARDPFAAGRTGKWLISHAILRLGLTPRTTYYMVTGAGVATLRQRLFEKRLAIGVSVSGFTFVSSVIVRMVHTMIAMSVLRDVATINSNRALAKGVLRLLPLVKCAR